MRNDKKLALLLAALTDGATEWRMDEIDESLTGFYPEDDDQYPQYTRYCIVHEENSDWIAFKDYWLDGHVVTDWGFAMQC